MLSISECTVKRCVMQKGEQAIVGGWAKPYYLGSPGLMPAGPVVVYTTKYEGALEVRL
jgi:hypothetical protein